MRLLITGDRNWATGDRKQAEGRLLFSVLDEFHKQHGIDVLIEGCATGADWLAGGHPPVYAPSDPDFVIKEPGWAWVRKVPSEHYPANWAEKGRAAGPIRNAQMLRDGKPDYAIAFHPELRESKGTRDMVKKLLKASIPVMYVSGWQWMPFLATEEDRNAPKRYYLHEAPYEEFVRSL